MVVVRFLDVYRSSITIIFLASRLRNIISLKLPQSPIEMSLRCVLATKIIKRVQLVDEVVLQM